MLVIGAFVTGLLIGLFIGFGSKLLGYLALFFIVLYGLWFLIGI